MGIEPTNGGFANLCLTTWLLRRNARERLGRASTAGCQCPDFLEVENLRRSLAFPPERGDWLERGHVSDVSPFHSKPHRTMLHWTLVFLVIALIAAIFGFTGVAGTAANIAKILFVIFLVLWLISFLLR